MLNNRADAQKTPLQSAIVTHHRFINNLISHSDQLTVPLTNELANLMCHEGLLQRKMLTCVSAIRTTKHRFRQK